MNLSEKVRRAVARRMDAVERAFGAIEGLVVERRADAVLVRGRRLARRAVEDVRIRFAGLSR